MSIINLIRTSIYSLKSHKLRVFLTMIGIIIGISSVITILAIGNGLKAEVNKSMESTSANKINVYFEADNTGVDFTFIEAFSKSDLLYLKKVKGVEKAEVTQGFAGFSFTSGEIAYFDKTAFVMLDDYDGKKVKVEHGRFFKEGEKASKLIVLVLNGIGLLGVIGSLAMKDVINETVKEMGVPEITTSALIISIAFIAIITISVILILMKKEIGIYMYFIAQVANIVYAVVISGFQLVQLVSFIMPVLMGIFIWQKKEVFGLGAKAEDVSL